VKLFELYRSLPISVCFDNDQPAGDAPEGETQPAAPPVTFTQEQVNKILAEDRRKHQAQMQRVEKHLQETLATAKLTQEERQKLEDTLENIQKQLRTKEEQAKIEKKQLEDKFTRELNEWKTKAEVIEKKYLDSIIHRSLHDAAVAGDAFNPNQIVTILRPFVKMVDEKPMVDFPDVSAETGEPIVKQMTPDEAIKRMKQLPETYGNLFKSGVVGGVGAASATGGFTPGSGKVDPRNLTMTQYLELRKKNPAALGLRPPR
jgi:hypothetical protein